MSLSSSTRRRSCTNPGLKVGTSFSRSSLMRSRRQVGVDVAQRLDLDVRQPREAALQRVALPADADAGEHDAIVGAEDPSTLRGVGVSVEKLGPRDQSHRCRSDSGPEVTPGDGGHTRRVSPRTRASRQGDVTPPRRASTTTCPAKGTSRSTNNLRAHGPVEPYEILARVLRSPRNIPHPPSRAFGRGGRHVTMAPTIGATTAVFSIVDGVPEASVGPRAAAAGKDRQGLAASGRPSRGCQSTNVILIIGATTRARLPRSRNICHCPRT